MKNKCKFLFILAFVIVSLFYRDNSVVAMAAEQNIEFVAEPDEEQNIESATEPDEEQNVEPSTEPDGEQSIEPVVEPAKPEQNIKSAAESQEEQSTESACESEAEQDIEPADESEPELIIESYVVSPMETTQDFVSTGPALIEWLESHKNTGGTVKLADHVVLEGYYCYCPDGVNRPSVFVDTDRYTITITGEIELMSDNHLIFSGQPDGRSIFYVAEKGMLSMLGVAVESGQFALWQEEGAGLVIEDCHLSGSIRYADTPFVMYNKSICVIIENGQTIYDVLPAQISCTVNRQGQLSYNELVPLTWNLEETEKKQEERQRFQLQGSFLCAASAEPALCTVVYNDYPLTFTDVKASVSGNRCTFQGGYRLSKESLPIAVMSEKSLPITVMSEYSFDGENWFMYEEQKVSNTYESFFIAFKAEQWDIAVHPNVYIRLQCNDNGTKYSSNVLYYAAVDLEHAEDMGGSRGGGTSIINPPDQPQKNIEDAPSKDEEPIQNANRNTNSDNIGSETPSDMNQMENGEGDVRSDVASDGQTSSAEISNADSGQTLYSASLNTNEEQKLYTESEAVNAGHPSYTETKTEDNVKNVYNSDIKESFNRSNPAVLEKKEGAAIIAAGFVLMAASAGIGCYCIHSRLGTNR